MDVCKLAGRNMCELRDGPEIHDPKTNLAGLGECWHRSNELDGRFDPLLWGGE